MKIFRVSVELSSGEERTLGFYTSREVAEFRANGARLFARVGEDPRLRVSEEHVEEATSPQEWLAKNGLGARG